MKKPSVSEALEFRQVEYGWTQREMADALGLSCGHYNEVLQGKRSLPYRSACLAYDLGVPGEILLDSKARLPKRARVYGKGRRRPAKTLHSPQGVKL